jgi:hypothetical protein
MATEKLPTANSGTVIEYDSNWLVLDVGSGHNPHKRANVLVDRFLLDDTERSGQPVVLPSDKLFVIADASALPFKSKAFDFVICSHVAEHIEEPQLPTFCSELSRVAKQGYVETPSVFAETLRHAPNHRWFVSQNQNTLIFRPTPSGYPLGWFGKLFWSLFFYKTVQVEGGRDVFNFSHGLPKPLHYIFLINRRVLREVWLLLKPITFMRLRWEGHFSCHIEQAGSK